MSYLEKNFNELLLEAIDEGLSSLGESSKEAIYFQLEKGFNIKKHEIPNKVKAFTNAVEKIFGLGGNFLEILIMQRLYERVGGNLVWHESRELTFVEYVAAAKECFLRERMKDQVVQ